MSRAWVAAITAVLVCSVVSGDIIYENDMSSSADFTCILGTGAGLSAGGFQCNFNSGGGGKARLRSHGSSGPVGPTAPERFASAYKTAALTAGMGYHPVLTDSTMFIRWSFNLTDAFGNNDGTAYGGDAAGGSSSNDIGGVVVAASDPDVRNAGVGYAVALSESDDNASQASLKFLRYSGGLGGTVTELIEWTAADNSDTGLHEISAEATSVVLIYSPSSELWTLAGHSEDPDPSRNVFAEVWPDPLSLAYTANDTKSVVDATHTSESLGNLALFLATDASVPQTYFDNLKIETVVPEPATLALLLGGALGLVRRNRR